MKLSILTQLYFSKREGTNLPGTFGFLLQKLILLSVAILAQHSPRPPLCLQTGSSRGGTITVSPLPCLPAELAGPAQLGLLSLSGRPNGRWAETESYRGYDEGNCVLRGAILESNVWRTWLVEGTNRCREGDQSEGPAGKRRPGCALTRGTAETCCWYRKVFVFLLIQTKMATFEHTRNDDWRPGGSRHPKELNQLTSIWWVCLKVLIVNLMKVSGPY